MLVCLSCSLGAAQLQKYTECWCGWSGPFVNIFLIHCPGNNPLAVGSKSLFLLGEIGGITDGAMPHVALHTVCAYYIGVSLDTDMQGRGS